MRQIRAIASSPVYITRETHQQVLQNLRLDDPFHYIVKAADKAYARLTTACCSPSIPEFMISIQDSARDVLHELRSVLLPSLDVGVSMGHVTCQQCGRTRGSMGALTSHMRRYHDKPGSFCTTAEDKQVSRALHSQDGLPICKHCHRHFSRWQQFLQHISRGLCPVLLEKSMPDVGLLSAQPTAHLQALSLDPKTSDALLRTVSGGPRALLQQLSRHCAFCSQWVASPKVLKAHIRRSHTDFWSRHHDAASIYCKQHSSVLGNLGSCRLCDAQVKNLQLHAPGCLILYQAGLAFSARRELWPTSQWGPTGLLQTTLRWQRGPGPQSSCQLTTLAREVLQALNTDGWGSISDELAQRLTTSCVICGAVLKGNSNTKRHYKSAHLVLWQSLSSMVAQSCTLGRASKPCHYCKRQSSSSKAVHLQTCSVLFQLRFISHLLDQGLHGYGDARATNGSTLRGHAAPPLHATVAARGSEPGVNSGPRLDRDAVMAAEETPPQTKWARTDKEKGNGGKGNRGNRDQQSQEKSFHQGGWWQTSRQKRHTGRDLEEIIGTNVCLVPEYTGSYPAEPPRDICQVEEDPRGGQEQAGQVTSCDIASSYAHGMGSLAREDAQRSGLQWLRKPNGSRRWSHRHGVTKATRLGRK